MGGHAVVLVLGDVGRSPRMCNHAVSLATQADMTVDLIGYQESIPRQDVVANDKIKLRRILPFPAGLPRSLFLLYAPLKILFQIFQLLFTLLLLISPPDLILVQNPPSIPVLAVLVIARLALRLRGRTTRLVIDWHNFGYTILQLSFSPGHPVVRVAKAYEYYFGRMADANLCVTQAMQQFLREEWGIKATVLYDKPPDCFKETPLDEAHRLMMKLEEENQFSSFFHAHAVPIEKCDDGELVTHSLVAAEYVNDQGQSTFVRRENRPCILVSSTSWTPDEDFSILLDAILSCDQQEGHFPQILLFVTGKGPMKAQFENRIKTMNLARTRVVTCWLAAEDYPTLLGMSDLGISLHTSSSGLDLPMKVVDMFGCHLPVCAINFPCLHELVQHEENGLVFDSSEQLGRQILDLFKGFPENREQLLEMKKKTPLISWTRSWDESALPLIQSILH